jgi:long-chain acyl-CoA synthetase
MHRDRPALKLDDNTVSYDMLNEGVARVAGLLADNGLQPGDRVGVMLPNVPYFGFIYYGVLRAGGVVLPMNVLLKGREVGFYLSDSGAKQLFVWGAFATSAVESTTVGTAEPS